MLAVTHKQLMALQPCGPRARAVTRGMGGASKWTEPADCARLREAGATLDDLVWLASAVARTDADTERRLRLWLADCAARVLRIYERTEPSDAPRNAIIAARQFARGEIDAAARDAARDAAWDAARAVAWDAAMGVAWAAARDAAMAAARDAARDAARGAARAVAWDAARDAAWAVAWDAARGAARAVAWDAAMGVAWDAARDAARDAAMAAARDAAMDAAWDAARAAEEAWQLDRLIARMSDAEPDDYPLPVAKSIALAVGAVWMAAEKVDPNLVEMDRASPSLAPMPTGCAPSYPTPSPSTDDPEARGTSHPIQAGGSAAPAPRSNREAAMGGERDDAKAFLGRCVTEANEVAARMGARLVVDEEKRAVVEAGLREPAPRVGAAIACAASGKGGERDER